MRTISETQLDEIFGIGSAVTFKQVIEEARMLAKIPRPIMIQGERGTGKELLARAIHLESDRKKQPYVVVNCAAFQEDLFAAEMFGGKKARISALLIRVPADWNWPTAARCFWTKWRI